MSKVDIVYSPVPFALQASLRVNILNGKSNFSGKITAWTTRSESRIILYDSDVAGTETKVGNGGSVSLTRSIVAVPRKADLVLKISVYEGAESYSGRLVLGHSVEGRTCNLGPNDLQVYVVWTGVFRQVSPNMWKEFNNTRVLW
uniref:DUF6598 domain-containing protein n=1 Tax=Arundo donax TaxID=35708 RepID=A0A0A9BGW0_ARUDO